MIINFPPNDPAKQIINRLHYICWAKPACPDIVCVNDIECRKQARNYESKLFLSLDCLVFYKFAAKHKLSQLGTITRVENGKIVWTKCQPFDYEITHQMKLLEEMTKGYVYKPNLDESISKDMQIVPLRGHTQTFQQKYYQNLLKFDPIRYSKVKENLTDNNVEETSKIKKMPKMFRMSFKCVQKQSIQNPRNHRRKPLQMISEDTSNNSTQNENFNLTNNHVSQGVFNTNNFPNRISMFTYEIDEIMKRLNPGPLFRNRDSLNNFLNYSTHIEDIMASRDRIKRFSAYQKEISKNNPK